MAEQRANVAIVGGGILGIAHAWAAASHGMRVVLFERGQRATGASVRNFGMIWPIGQPSGELHCLALRSRAIWCEVLRAAGLPFFPAGSLHLCYRDDEAEVAREFAEQGPGLGYDCAWLPPGQALARSAAARPDGLRGALWSSTEMVVDPRLVMQEFPRYLAARYGVELRYGLAVRAIDLPCVLAGSERWLVDCAIVCGGDDFETLYPEVLAATGLTRCKLQMMRTCPQPDGWRLGPALAGGLTLRFYDSFRICDSLVGLQRRIAEEMPEYNRWGIHVMVSQTSSGEVTIGDSHAYGPSVDPFDKAEIDDLILRYFEQMARLPNYTIAQRWHGVYAKHQELPFVALAPAPGVRVVTAAGGAGLTLSFGLAERTWAGLCE